ncbi:MAG: hypothetical protein IBX58_14315 [Roseovarius sp.]|nr:hypothetical protein [Roseovarius sp.]
MIGGKVIIAAAGAALLAGIWMHGHSHGQRTERLHWQGQQAEAVQSARKTEQQRYGDLLDALNAQYLAQRDIADRLDGDLERLRNRPPRIVRVPGDPAPDCTGTTGAELSREDAGFLVRESARADRHREALAACYAYADSLQKQGVNDAPR